MLTNSFKNGLQTGHRYISKNSPIILTSFGVVGVFSTAVLAVKATPKAMRIIEENQDVIDSKEDLLFKKLEVVRLTWKCYVPAAAISLSTATCIIMAHRVSARRSAVLASVYALTETAFKEYRTKVEETIGTNKEGLIRDDIAKDRLIQNPVSTNEVIITASGDVLCYDALSGRYFTSDVEKIHRVIRDLNHELLSATFISLNELYYELGLSGIELGENIGWDVSDGFIDANFSSQLLEGEKPCLVLNFVVAPKYTQ